METPPNSSWSESLTRRLRVLLHTSPLHDLRRRFLRGPASMRHYDALALATRAMDAVVDRSGLEEEASREDVLRVLRPLLEAMDAEAGVRPRAARHAQVIDRIIEGLRNDADKQRPFSAEYTELGADGAATRRLLEFRLLSDTHHPSGRTALRLSNEAVNLTLRLLDLDIEDAQAATEAVVRSQLDRGRFEEALQSARQARFQSLRFQQKVMQVARETRRDVDRMDWREAIPELINDALEHVARRLESEQSILSVAEERLDLLDEQDARVAVATVGDLIRDCRMRHVELHEELMKLRGVFLDAQAHQAFVPAATTPLPELRRQVLEPLLSMGRGDAQGVIDRAAPALLGASAPGLPRLTSLVGWLLMPRRAAPKDCVPVAQIDAAVAADPPPRFPAGVRGYVETLLESVSEPVSLSELLGRARREGAGDEVLELLVLTTLQHFAPDNTHQASAPALPNLLVRRLDTPLMDPDFSGDELELQEAHRANQ